MVEIAKEEALQELADVSFALRVWKDNDFSKLANKIDIVITTLRKSDAPPTICGLTPYQIQLSLDGANVAAKELSLYHAHGIWEDNYRNFFNIPLLVENMEKFFQHAAGANE